MAALFQDFNPFERAPVNQYGSGGITRGSLISFHYPKSFSMDPNVIHDPKPMVIITDVWPQHIRGLNLHYLTFPYIKRILENFGGNTGFSYLNIKPDRYLANAFRMYARVGVLRPKRLDTEWLKGLLLAVRSFDPGEIEKIKLNIQKQIQQRLQVKANELTSYEEWRKSMSMMQQNQLQNQTNNIFQNLTGNFNQPQGPMEMPQPEMLSPNQQVQPTPGSQQAQNEQI